MAYSQSVLRAARARLAQAKAERDAENAGHLAEAYERYPRLAEIDRALSATVAKAVAASMRAGEDPSQAIETLREKNLALQRERAWLLSGLEEGFLDDSPICPKCGGSGYVGDQMCECLRELCRQEQKRELTSLLGAGNARFEQFRLDVYPDEHLEEFGCSARSMMRLNLSRCKRYAANFAPGAESMLFTGGPGLGKTFLSACIARAVADGGHSVVYETVIRMFSDFENAKFGDYSEENQSRTDKYLNCDLLIMDDLGSEMTTAFTMSALYTVVNSRLMEGRATIISTNLTPDAISARYTQAICSRLLGSYRLMQFLGNDLRRKEQ
ncbi:MAG: DNA replication protein DnaC [Ruminococcaceae bacterium]|jgi:DNA replication protein DnaC|nr:DNA replication protein DnaC [Oscillospiraceae bacterium]